MLFEAEKNDEVLLSKKVVLILNKRDLLNDEEILREYKSTLYAELQTFFREKGLAKIEEGLLEANTFVTSAGTYYGVGELLRKFAELLQNQKIMAIILKRFLMKLLIMKNMMKRRLRS